ncbi:hypothetical protein [Ruminococcus sp.]|uniref:hypothetical protein n=1 Tax=Ruminococcus sp. TaxID=41978 RepID=UPI0025F5C45F|nr:hypothetical protein [Ruminococcus sp.]MBQ8965893.1 hypothetical protein [Ruminococcus sp.]
MGKFAGKLGAFALVVWLAVLTAARGYALDFDPMQLEVECKDSPEGTAYVDILVQLDVNDESCIDFNGAPVQAAEDGYVPMDIGRDSEIAKFCEDGYVSLTLHSSLVKRYVIGDSGCHIELGIRADDLYDRYGEFRAAYVGYDGSVLAVTGKTSRAYDNRAPYAVVIDGDRAEYRSFGISPTLVVLMAAGALAFMGLIVLAAVVTAKVFVAAARKSRADGGRRER